MTVHMGQSGFISVGQGQQTMIYAHEMLTDNIQLGTRQEPVNIGDATGHRVFNRHHGQLRRTVAQSGKGVIETGARHHRHVGISVDTGNMAIGAQFTLKSDFTHSDCSFSTASACAKSSGVSTPTGTVSTIAALMVNPASNARNCSSFSRCSSGDGGKATNLSKAAR